MFRFCVFLLLLFPSLAATAQRVDPPKDKAKYYLTVFTHDDWANRPDEVRLLKQLDEQPMLKLKASCHYNHYTTSDPVYSSGRYWNIREPEFPVVVISDPRGGYFYKASKGNIPSTSAEMFEDAKTCYYRDKEANASNKEAQASQDCPDGMCPLQPTPPPDRQPVFPNAPWNDSPEDQEWGGVFGGDTPVRDTFASVGWVIGCVVVLFFLAIVFIGFISVFGLVAILGFAFKR